MSLNICQEQRGQTTAAPMKGTPFQIRAKRAGLTQRMLARIAGKPENTVSRQLAGEFGPEAPLYLHAMIIAWEVMTDDQRADWMERVAADRA